MDPGHFTHSVELAALEEITRGESLGSVLETICRCAEGQAPDLLTSILLLDADGVHLRYGAAPSLPEVYCRGIDGLTVGPDAGCCGTAVYTRGPVIASDIGTDPLWEHARDAALRHGLRACWSTPIFSSTGAVLGTFAGYYREPRGPTPDERGLVERLSHLASIAIERHRTIRQLAEREDLLRAIIETEPECVKVLARDGALLQINRAGLRMVEADHLDQVLGRPVWDLVAPESREAFRALHDAVLGGESRTLEFELIGLKGSRRWVETHAVPLARPPEPGCCHLAITRDITRRKQAEQALRDNEQRLQLASEVARIGYWDWDIPSNRVVYSVCLGSLFGLPPGRHHPDYEAFLQSVHPDDRGRVDQAVKAAVERGAPYGLEFRAVWPDGSVHWLENKGRVFTDEAGRPLRMVGVARDIDDRKRTETALRESETRFRTLFEDAPIGVTVVGPDLRFRQVNKAFCRMLGYAPDELIGRSYVDITHPEDVAPNVQLTEQAIRGDAPTYRLEKRYIKKDGAALWVNLTATVLPHRAGEEPQLLAMTEDITARKQAERELQESYGLLRVGEERYRALYDDNPSMYFTVAPDGTILSVNRFGAEQLGYSTDELVGRAVLMVIHPEDRPAVTESLADCLRRKPQIAHWEFRKVRKDGSVLWVRESARVVAGQHGGEVILVVCEDITERKQAEEAVREREQQLRRASEQRERMSQDLHDNILQSLYAVGLGLEAATPLIKENPRKAAQSVGRAMSHLNLVMQDVRQFIAGLESDPLQGVSLEAALTRLAREATDARTTRFSADIDPMVAQDVPRDQAIHLLNIAREAVSNSLRHARARAGALSLRGTEVGARLEIRDDGVGFPARAVSGKGHGLRNMRARARKIGGRLSVRSQAGRGTSIVVTIPKTRLHAGA